MVVRSNLWMVLAATAALGTAACQKDEAAADTDAGPTGGGGGGGPPPGGSNGGESGGNAQGGNDTGGNGGEAPPPGGSGGNGDGGSGGGGGAVTGGSGGGGGAGGEEPPAGTIRVGDVCDPTNDECVADAFCNDFGLGAGPLCYAGCDTVLRDTGEPSGCDLDEVCLDYEQCDPGVETCVGLCLPSDRCEPCNADSCGGPHSCLALEPAALCLTAGTQPVGQACLAADADPVAPENNCEDGLVCAFGSCAQSCGSDTCGGGGTCADGDVCADFAFKTNGAAYAFCYKDCSLSSQTGCAENEVCVIQDNAQVGEDVVALGGCTEADEGTLAHGEDCTVDEQTYWGDCSAGHYCADVFHKDDDPLYQTMCNGICDMRDQSACTGAAGCYFGLFRLQGLGICLGECDAWGDSSDCGDGKKCELLTIGVGPEGEMALGMCNAAPAGEPAATGDDCTLDEDTGASDCASGNLCLEVMAGQPRVCIAVCDSSPESVHACPAGYECKTGTLGSEDNPSDVFGLCAPLQ